MSVIALLRACDEAMYRVEHFLDMPPSAKYMFDRKVIEFTDYALSIGRVS